MPREDRRIIFDNEEIYKALYALCSQKQMPMPPPGAISRIIVDAKDENRITVVIANPLDSKKEPEHCEYSRDFIAAALMLMCRGIGIPLPKGAAKSVLIKDDQVMLRVQL